MNKQISILGCGWLGWPLATSLIESGFSVKGSTTSENKLALLEENKIQPFLISLLEDKIEGNITDFLKDSEILIIDIPPGLRRDTSVSFVAKIKTLVNEIEKTTIKKVIFISSTSVYRDTSFFPTPLEVTEETPANPDTESGKQLVAVEELLLGNPNFDTTIIRFGGLISEDRHPVKYLAGKENVENPDGPINFIHQEDCIGIIKAVIEKGLRQAQSDGANNEEMLKQVQKDKGLRQAQSDSTNNDKILKQVQEDKGLRQAQSDSTNNDKILKQVQHDNNVFNAVAPEHPTRQEYYHKKAKNMNLALPIFAENTVSKGKIVLSTKIETVLSYTFKKEI